MSDTHCPYCGSVGTCHDSCVGVEIEPLKKRIADLEAENAGLRDALKSIADSSRDIVARLCARDALGLLEKELSE
jgi:hypothetical protein